MNLHAIILPAAFEALGLGIVVRIWLRVLVLPLSGVLRYALAHTDADAHPDEVGDSGWDVGGDDHGGDGH